MESVCINQIASALNITNRSAQRRSKRQKWKGEAINGRGDLSFRLADLPADVQTAIVNHNDIPAELLPALKPEAALAAAKRMVPGIPSINIGIGVLSGQTPATWSDKTAIDPKVLHDPKVKKWVAIIQEAEGCPKGWQKRKWVEAVAAKHETTHQTIYRKLQTYRKKGLSGLHHTKTNKGEPRAWSPEAVEWWIGLCLKREHRKMDRKRLYAILWEEARKRSWAIGGYESAQWWFRERVSPQLLAMQRGGSRALDNLLPPVVRDYSDLSPFEILVGDQHRFDFWVTDEDTGEVFRPEGYFWQDLRTRAFYGGALDKKYDSYLMGLALRMGMRIFGPFGSIYTDHGKPEESLYILGILKDMRAIGLNVHKTIEVPGEESQIMGEDINPLVMMPGNHRHAIVRNAKAKMIEGTFYKLEEILRSVFRVPGWTRKLGGSQDENEIDQISIDRYAEAGKLLTFQEFFLTLLKAMDHYNNKPHRGVLREWAWRPKPKEATPMDCLKACYLDGWRPASISEEATDLVFLARSSRPRVVDRGRINFQNGLYEHEVLVPMHGERVNLRYDPMDPEWVLVFQDERFVCRAEPVEYSSMKDMTLAQRKVEEKRRLRKGFVTEYRRLTSAVPDCLEYSKTAPIEKAAAVLRAQDRKLLTERKETLRERTPEELEAEIARIRAVPERPIFSTELARYQWLVDQIGTGEGRMVTREDREFMARYERAMDDATRDFWENYRQTMNINLKAGGESL